MKVLRWLWSWRTLTLHVRNITPMSTDHVLVYIERQVKR